MINTKFIPSNTIFLLFSLFSGLFISTTVSAANFCEPDCSIVINFPEGGSVTAVEAVMITFGEGAVINDGAVATGYSAGETQTLAAGEVMNFAAGGVLNLGDAGNIDYTSMAIEFIGGAMTVTANGDVNLSTLDFEGGDLTITAEGSITITGTVDVSSGSIMLNSDTTIDETGDITISNGVTLGGTGEITVLPSGTLTLENGGVLTSTSDPVSIEILESVTESSAVAFPVSQDELADGSFEGSTYLTSDGKTCTITDGHCLTENGVEYVLSDGVFVHLSDNGNSSVNLALMLLLMSLLACLRHRQVCY